MKHLEFLNLNGNEIDDEGILHLSKLQVPSLTKINLGIRFKDIEGNHLSSKSIKHLTKNNWKAMKGVHLCTYENYADSNNIRIDGVPYFLITFSKLDLVRLSKIFSTIDNNCLHETSTRNIINQFESRFLKIGLHI